MILELKKRLTFSAGDAIPVVGFETFTAEAAWSVGALGARSTDRFSLVSTLVHI